MGGTDPRIRLGVIGCGHWGPNHIRNFASSKGATVVWAADTSEARRQHVASLYESIRFTDSADEVFADESVDAVVIATPTRTHHALCLAAIRAGKDVLCEKPLAIDSAECEGLVVAAKEHGVVLMVGHVFLFNGGILKLKELISTGDLGKIHYASAQRTNLGPIREDVNASYDLASHDVSIFNYLFDCPPLTVSARGGSYLNTGIEDVVFATLTYPNGVVVGIEVSWLNPKKVRQITIVGDRKMVTWDDLSAGPVSIYDKGVAREPFYDSFGEFHLLTREGDVTIPKIALDEPLKRQARFFLDAIRSRDASYCDGTHGWDVVRTLEAIEESMRNASVAVPIGRSARPVRS